MGILWLLISFATELVITKFCLTTLKGVNISKNKNFVDY